MSLYNYRRGLDASFDMQAPSSQRLRFDMGPYPGGTPNLTDRILNEPNINKGYQQETNGAIKVTIKTKTRDQDQINRHQLAFVDTDQHEKPRLLSLEQLNQILLSAPSKKFPIDDKTYIEDRYKLFGVVVNSDADNGTMPMDRLARTFTCTVRGDVHVLDYWSRSGVRFRRYDLCYFVLKKVFITSSYTFQVNLTSRMNHEGVPPPSNAVGHYRWQIVPFCTKDRTIRPEQYKSFSYTVGGVEVAPDNDSPNRVKNVHIGTYWRVGFSHEYASIESPDKFTKRDETTVARDVAALHCNGSVAPIQFYLWFDDGSKCV